MNKTPNTNTIFKVKKPSENERYLRAVFELIKKRDALIVSDRKTHFNDTEIRLLSEILTARYDGERLISTQLAKRLGVTRSAISQIVNRLEGSGVVKRVPDAVDRKIAYIEITDETMDTYGADLKICKNFVGRVVKKFGAERFEEMCVLMNEFMSLVTEEGKSVSEKKHK